MSTCGECPHFDGCKDMIAEAVCAECPARTNEREMLKALEASAEVLGLLKRNLTDDELFVLAQINKAIQKQGGIECGSR
jgi:hypothetical protein